MPNIIMIFLSAVLFFLLVPGVLFKIPSGSASKYTVAACHAVIYAIIGFFFHDPLQIWSSRLYLTNR